MKKRLLCLISAVILILSVSVNAAVLVDYNYSESVTPGTVRYVSQIRSSDVYYQDYWGRFSPWAHNECGTASVSMALSAIGINKTPLDLGNYWISRGYTWGNPFSTVLNDVPGATGGETYDFFASFDRYINGDGSYSPVIIYFTAATNPNRTGNRHFVVVTEKKEDGSFNAVNPSNKAMLNLKIEKTSGGSLYVTVYGHKGTTSGYISEYDFRSAQYHNPNFVKPAAEEVPPAEAAPATEETVAAEEVITEEAQGTEEATAQTENTEAPANEQESPVITPEFLFPASLDASAPTHLSFDFCEIRFADTGCDTYTIYYRRADNPGTGATFTEVTAKAITATVGEGLIARNNDGTMSLFIPGGLIEGYMYRFFVSDANGVSCTFATYGIAK